MNRATAYKKCPRCNGSGLYFDRGICFSCGGKGSYIAGRFQSTQKTGLLVAEGQGPV
jgi:DnaJ-class molecular chaperone